LKPSQKPKTAHALTPRDKTNSWSSSRPNSPAVARNAAVKLNYPESSAIITYEVIEGVSRRQKRCRLMAYGAKDPQTSRHVIGRIAEMISVSPSRGHFPRRTTRNRSQPNPMIPAKNHPFTTGEKLQGQSWHSPQQMQTVPNTGDRAHRKSAVTTNFYENQRGPEFRRGQSIRLSPHIAAGNCLFVSNPEIRKEVELSPLAGKRTSTGQRKSRRPLD
ncbi:UNVERIFIED_CONTAM: hypothetical protein GTU68_062674, partial [Idotea baltica]|nr:hypothetical protein [Idotea baltica]